MRKLCFLFFTVSLLFITKITNGEEGRILAIVNGKYITEDTFREEFIDLPPYIKDNIKNKIDNVMLLDSLVTRELLFQEATRRNIDKEKEVANKIFNAKKNIMLEAILKEVFNKYPLTNEILYKYYKDNINNFKAGERVRVKHILFKDKDKAESILNKTDVSTRFDDLIRLSNVEGGIVADLGFIERGDFIKEFEVAAFSAKPGITTGPVKTIYGYHIILVSEKRSAGVKDFDEVKEKIETEMKDRNQREVFDTLLGELKKKGNIQVYNENIR